MREYKQNIEFFNFTCHFGDKVLLDYFDEIVKPAFTEGNRVRHYGKSRYLLLDVHLMQMNTKECKGSVPVIFGKFVLDTRIKRDQVLVDGKIVDSSDELQSSPSSLFLLTLHDHKLMYVKEVSGAPGISAFRTTIEGFLKYRRSSYIVETVNKAKEARALDKTLPVITQKSLFESIGVPDLKIVPLGGDISLNAFLNKFKILQEVSIKVMKPNQEINNDGLFQKVQNVRSAIDAESSTITHKNKNGLDKDNSLLQISPAISGNGLVTLRGIGSNDEELVGNTDQFLAKEPITLVQDIKSNALRMLSAFFRLKKRGGLKVDESVVSEKNIAKLKRI